MKCELVLIVVVCLAAFASGCRKTCPKSQSASQAKAVFHSGTSVSQNVSGTITFTKSGDKTRISGTLSGLRPGEHGFHIHTLGDLTKCTDAIGHYNPFNKVHGGPTDSVRHVGDLGNINADASGRATVGLDDPQVKLEGEHSVIGRMVVVHKDRDDLGKGGNEGSRTTGNAGARVACAVIGLTAA